MSEGIKAHRSASRMALSGCASTHPMVLSKFPAPRRGPLSEGRIGAHVPPRRRRYDGLNNGEATTGSNAPCSSRNAAKTATFESQAFGASGVKPAVSTIMKRSARIVVLRSWRGGTIFSRNRLMPDARSSLPKLEARRIGDRIGTKDCRIARSIRGNPVPFRDIPRSKCVLLNSILYHEKPGRDLVSWKREKPSV